MALLNGLQPYPLNYNPLLLQVEVYRRPQLDQLLFQDDYIIYMVLVSVRALDEQCDFLEFGG
jgi:ABC-type polysaccharide/polyol phosphate export permease